MAPIEWKDSAAKEQLKQDLLDGTIPLDSSEMGPRAVYELENRPEFRKFVYEKFRTNLNSLRKRKFNIREFSFDWEIFKQSLRIGLPTGLQQTFVALGMMALMGIVNGFGTDVVAAYTAAGRLDSLAIIPSMVFSTALSTFVGQNIGAGKIDRVKKGLTRTMMMASATAIGITLLVIVFKFPLMKLFTLDQSVIRIGGEYLTIVTSFYLLFTAMFVYGGVMRGAGDTIIPMFLTLFSLWIIRIPAALFLSQDTVELFGLSIRGAGMGESGIWWSIPVGWGFGLITSYLYYKTGKWKSKTVVKTKLEPATITR